MELGCHYGQGFLFAQAQGADYWLHPGHRLPG